VRWAKGTKLEIPKGGKGRGIEERKRTRFKSNHSQKSPNPEWIYKRRGSFGAEQSDREISFVRK